MSTQKRLIHIFLSFTVLTALLSGSLSPAQAYQSTQNLDSAPGGPSDPVEVEAFVDSILFKQLEEGQIPGATVTVVRDGKLLFSKGYGYANLETREAVDPAQTRFHIGSLTKLFTWTAVMQLVEQGKLDLHTNINQYLPPDLQLPATYPEPVTLHHLLTHTAGFEDKLSSIFSTDPASLIPLQQYLKMNRPNRVYQPGTIIAYSNWGTALAGLVVQQVSGEPYEAYINRHIFQPLGMQHSIFQQPERTNLAGSEAMGYGSDMEGAPLAVQEYLPNNPAGGSSSTAEDMARFMITHLQNGAYGDKRILSAETAVEMHRQHYTSDPRLAGMAYGFIELNRNGKHILWHSGGTAVFFSMLTLIPEDQVGFFISYNGMGGSDARVTFRQAFLDHYYPAAASAPQPLPDAGAEAARYQGLYRESRFAFSTVDKLMSSMSWMVVAKVNPDGTLHYRGADWIAVEPGVFMQVNGQGTLIFKQDQQGRTLAVQDIDPHEVQTRIDAYENPMLILSAGGVLLLILLSALFVVPAAFHRKREINSRAIQQSAWLIFAIALLALAFLLWTLIGAGIIVLRNPIEIMGSLGKLLVIPLGLLLLAVLLTPLALFFTWLAWRKRSGSLRLRVYCTVLAGAAVLFALWLNYWNLIGWHI